MTIADDVLRAKQDFDDVYEAGRKAEYDAFWDAYQQNGNRTDYNYAFANYLWTRETFRPKYNIAPTTTNFMFQFNAIGGDLVDILEDLGIVLDFSKTTGMTNLFAGSKFTRIGEIDTRSTSSLNSCFVNATLLETIDKLKVREDLRYISAFAGCTNLKNLTIEGIIGQNGFDTRICKELSKASITSIINALSTTTSDLTVTLSKTAVDTAFEGGSGGGEFHYLIDSKENWKISLA